eukprot:CAMPEP_0168173806 /NCGR_PEP_ID=MMETSP0139_2-20121125/6120_1 /TAXON_ID=44445 /ORGANISM="Pseudo-nitzschia australis, Strain 10249 10 AB" /LENGTH=77 /DNA_ID=CAMNT_0008091821 /DNA_START=110 /DNA_END=343 /DNA_ORIENTATION=-
MTTPTTTATIIYNTGCLTAGFSADATNMWKTSSSKRQITPTGFETALRRQNTPTLSTMPDVSQQASRYKESLHHRRY